MPIRVGKFSLEELKDAGLIKEEAAEAVVPVDYCTGKPNIGRLLDGDTNYWDDFSDEVDYSLKTIVISNWQYALAMSKAYDQILEETGFEQDKQFFQMLLDAGCKIVVWEGEDSFDTPIKSIIDLNKSLAYMRLASPKNIKAALEELKIPVDDVFIFDHQRKIKLFQQLYKLDIEPNTLNFAETRLLQRHSDYENLTHQAMYLKTYFRMGRYTHLHLDVHNLEIVKLFKKEILDAVTEITLDGYIDPQAEILNLARFFPNLQICHAINNQHKMTTLGTLAGRMGAVFDGDNTVTTTAKAEKIFIQESYPGEILPQLTSVTEATLSDPFPSVLNWPTPNKIHTLRLRREKFRASSAPVDLKDLPHLETIIFEKGLTVELTNVNYQKIKNLIIEPGDDISVFKPSPLKTSPYFRTEDLPSLTKLVIKDPLNERRISIDSSQTLETVVLANSLILARIDIHRNNKIKYLTLTNLPSLLDLDFENFTELEALTISETNVKLRLSKNQNLKKLIFDNQKPVQFDEPLPQSLEELSFINSNIPPRKALFLGQLSNLKYFSVDSGSDVYSIIWPYENHIQKLTIPMTNSLVILDGFPCLNSVKIGSCKLGTEKYVIPCRDLTHFIVDRFTTPRNAVIDCSQLNNLEVFETTFYAGNPTLILPKETSKLTTLRLDGSYDEKLDLRPYINLRNLKLAYKEDTFKNTKVNPAQITTLELNSYNSSNEDSSIDLSQFTNLEEVTLSGRVELNAIKWPQPNKIKKLNVETQSHHWLCSWEKFTKLKSLNISLLAVDYSYLDFTTFIRNNMLEELTIHANSHLDVLFPEIMQSLNSVVVSAGGRLSIETPPDSEASKVSNLTQLDIVAGSVDSIELRDYRLNSVRITTDHRTLDKVEDFAGAFPGKSTQLSRPDTRILNEPPPLAMPDIARQVPPELRQHNYLNVTSTDRSDLRTGKNPGEAKQPSKQVFEIAENGEQRGFKPNYYRIALFNAVKLEDKTLVSYHTDVSQNYQACLPSRTERQTQHIIADDIVNMNAPMLVTKHFAFLPSLLVYEELLFLADQHKYDVIYSPERNQYAIKLKSDYPLDREQAVVSYQIKIKNEPFSALHQMPDSFAQHHRMLDPKIRAELDKVQNHPLLRDFLTPGDDDNRIKMMVHFFNTTFICEDESANITPDPSSPEWLLPLLQQKGVCRHRARMAALICEYNQWPYRQVGNEIHQFIEIYQHGKWVMYCLGGGRPDNDIKLEKVHEQELSYDELMELYQKLLRDGENSHNTIAQVSGQYVSADVAETGHTDTTDVNFEQIDIDASEPEVGPAEPVAGPPGYISGPPDHSPQFIETEIEPAPEAIEIEAEQPNRFAKLFLTPQKRYDQVMSTDELYREIQADQRVLIRLPSANIANELSANLLNEFLKNPHGNYIYIRSAREMRSLLASAQVIEGQLSTVPGALKKLLANDGMLVINWDNFTPNEMAIYKSLFDETPTLNSIPVSPKLKIVNFESSSRGSEAFYSRFKNNIVRLPTEFYQQLTMPELSPTPAVEQPDMPVNLYSSTADWKRILLGNIVINRDHFDFEPGAIDKMLADQKSHLKLIDAPLSNEDFREFIQEIAHTKQVMLNGRLVKLPDDFYITFEITENYKPVHRLQAGRLPGSFEINSATYSLLFPHTAIDSAGVAVQHPGYLTLYKNFHITSNLSQGSFKRLDQSLAEDQFISAAENVTIENIKNGYKPTSQYANVPSDLPAESMVILSEDTDWTAAAQQKAWQIPNENVFAIGMETEFSDLIESFGLQNQKSLLNQFDQGGAIKNLKFDRTVATCWQKLSQGETVILKGKISPRLYTQLSSMFNAEHQLVVNGQVHHVSPQAGLGKVILITEESAEQKVAYPSHTAAVKLARNDIFSALQEIGGYDNEAVELLAMFYSFSEDKNIQLPCNWSILNSLLARLAQQDFPLAREKIVKTLLLAHLDPQSREYKLMNEEAKTLFSSDIGVQIDVAAGSESSQEKAVRRIVELFNHGKTKIVVLQGSAGLGKTHIASLLKSDSRLNAEIFWGEDSIEKCLNTVTDKKRILYIDEFNFNRDDHWKMFSQIDEGIITVKGKQYLISQDNPIYIVCSSNPADKYVGRYQQTVLPHRAVTLNVKQHSDAQLIEFVKLFSQNLPLVKNPGPEIYNNFIRAYSMVKEHFPNLDFSLRDIQSLCMRLEVIQRKYPIPNATQETYALLSIMHEFGGLFNQYYELEEFKERLLDACHTTADELQAAEDFIRQQPLNLVNYQVQPSRISTLVNVMEDLEMAELSKTEPGFHKYRRGVLLEGPSGVGKSKLGISLFETYGYENLSMVDEADRHNIAKGYYIITAGSGDEEKLLLDAFKNGRWVILDELNLNPKIEKLLNQLLTGKDFNDQGPDVPGFMVFSSQNPVNFEGVKMLSSALANRFHNAQVHEYPDQELEQIAVSKLAARQLGFAEYVKEFVAAYRTAIAEQKEDVLNTRTFFDVVNSDELAMMLTEGPDQSAFRLS